MKTLRLLNNIHEETKSTMIIVEHRLEESLDDTFDRVLLLKMEKSSLIQRLVIC